MQHSLAGRVVLVAEDEPLIALDLQASFEDHGALVISVSTVADAMRAVDDFVISAAVLDHALNDGHCSPLYESLKERNIPFVIYSGFQPEEASFAAALINKPASPDVVVIGIVGLLAGRN